MAVASWQGVHSEEIQALLLWKGKSAVSMPQRATAADHLLLNCFRQALVDGLSGLVFQRLIQLALSGVATTDADCCAADIYTYTE